MKTWGSLLIIPFIAQRILIWQKSILAAVPPNGGSGRHVLYAEMEYALSQQISFRQNRKNYSEFRALLGGGRRFDAPAVQFRDLFGESQSQAISGCVPGLFALIELFKNPVQILFGNSYACIAQENRNLFFFRSSCRKTEPPGLENFTALPKRFCHT